MDKISHAYLFTGSRGTGKTSTAKIFARAINCLHPIDGSPCGECEVCKSLEGTNIDVLEIDAASNNGVDEIRDLREKVKYPPVVGKYKVFIIDEVHMLSSSAFNALLKTLEEPPTHTVFVLATTEVHKLPATILSRCLRFDFKLVSLDDLSSLLKKVLKEEGVNFDAESINALARAGEGSVRDTLSIADRCVSFAGDILTYEKVISVLGISERKTLISISNKILEKNVGETLVELDKILGMGKSPLVFSNDLISYFRDLLLIYTLSDKSRDIIVLKDDDYDAMKNQATDKNYSEIVKAIEILSGVEQELRYSALPRMVLETAIIKIISENSLLQRVEKLEAIVGSANFPK
jgi:DNA polymerase-3 subunit gamma/tau